MQAIGTWKGGYETLLEDDHAHSLTVDLPVDEGGRSQGPSPLDLAFLALAGSLTTTFAQLAEKRHVVLYGLNIALEAERSRTPPTIARVRGTLRVRTRAEMAEVRAVLELARKTCSVSRLFEGAGIPIEVEPIVVPSAPPGPVASASR